MCFQLQIVSNIWLGFWGLLYRGSAPTLSWGTKYPRPSVPTLPPNYLQTLASVPYGHAVSLFGSRRISDFSDRREVGLENEADGYTRDDPACRFDC